MEPHIATTTWICDRSWILAAITTLVLGGCGERSIQEEKPPFEGDGPAEATVFAPGIISDTASVEFGISFMPDVRTVYFTSKKSGDSFYSIYVADYQDAQWRAPTIAPFSGEYFDADAFVTSDGSRIFFFSMRPISPDSPPSEIPDIWYVEREGDQWSRPVNLGRPVNRPETGEGFLTVTRDGTLYFSSMNREDAVGNHDIYRARHIDGAYSNPEYLDLAISTTFSNPLIAPDEQYLIVDSKQPGGYGGNDLYISFRDDDTWSTPQNLGPLINTDGEEGTPALSPDGRLLFFSRDGDIYYIAVQSVEPIHRANRQSQS